MPQHRNRKLCRKRRAVIAHQLVLDAMPDLLTGNEGGQLHRLELALRGQQKVREREREKLSHRNAQHLREPLIHKLKAAARRRVRHAHRSLVEGGRKALLHQPQLFLRTNTLPAPLRVGELALNRRQQTIKMPLEHIIVRARTHRVDRGDLIDRARHDDERNLDADSSE